MKGFGYHGRLRTDRSQLISYVDEKHGLIQGPIKFTLDGDTGPQSSRERGYVLVDLHTSLLTGFPKFSTQEGMESDLRRTLPKDEMLRPQNTGTYETLLPSITYIRHRNVRHTTSVLHTLLPGTISFRVDMGPPQQKGEQGYDAGKDKVGNIPREKTFKILNNEKVIRFSYIIHNQDHLRIMDSIRLKVSIIVL